MDELYHVWFSIKGRKPALDAEIGDRVKRLDCYESGDSAALSGTRV
jgi:hypothetical protein